MEPRELLLVLLSAFLHAFWNFSTKGSASPVAFALLLRAVLAVALLPVLPFFEPAEIASEVWLLLAASAVVHTFYFYFLARAYQAGDLSLVYPIARSTPAFVPLLAIPLLGEHLSPAGGAGIAIVVGGIWLVNAEGWRWRGLREPGIAFALLTLATTVGYSLLDKSAMATLGQGDWSGAAPRALVYFLILEVIGVPLLAVLALADVGREGLARALRGELPRAAAAGVAALASYTLILEAFRTASVSYVVAARQSSVLFALAGSAILLGERPGRVRLLGALLTVGGVALISLA